MLRPPSSSEIVLSPAERIRGLSARIGESAVASWCEELLGGRVRYDDAGRPSITWLGGGHAARLLRRRGSEVRGQDYWPRVWGARGLLYAWTPSAEGAILLGFHDPAWRVREMCARVARRRGVDRAEAELSRMLDDPVLRVRVAAEAALTVSARSQESHTPRSSPPHPRRR